MSSETIKVCCRFRKEFDHLDSDYDEWNFEEETATITLKEKKWTYDYILPPETTQESMYSKVAKKTILDFTEGYHGTIFAYGQSGSGKTYSMLGPDSVFNDLGTSSENELYGITPRAIYQIFSILNEFSRNGTNWKLCLSYIELYNEKIKCLLSGKEGLKIREDPHEGFVIPEKDMKDCKKPEDIFEGIDIASKNRAVGATNQNERSSRSHAIMQLELIYNSIDGLVRKSRLSLVDLAGSERIAKTGAEGQRLKEAQKINQSLTTLGMVIMALTTQGTKHIPFRNSKLTLILRDSLGGSSKTTLLCTASRLKRHSEESIQTLYFASRAKTIKNSTKKNVILNAGELQFIANGLKKELLVLRGQLKKVGIKWKLVEDKKILGFVGNEEFDKEVGSVDKEMDNKENNNNNKDNDNYEIKEEIDFSENGNLSDEERKKIIEELKEKMNLEREKLQKIIDDLFIKVDSKDNEERELKNKIEEYINQISQFQNIFKEKKELEIQINVMKKNIDEKLEKMSYMKSQISVFEIENDDLNNKIIENRKELENELKKYQKNLEKINSEITKNKMKLTEIEDKLKESENKKKSIENIYETKEKNYKNELMIIKDNIEKFNELLKQNISEKELLNEKEKINSQILESYLNINKEIKLENEKLKNEIEEEKKNSENEKNKIKEKYEKIINENKENLKNKENQIIKLTEQLKNLDNKFKNQNEKIIELNELTETEKKKIEESKNLINKKEENLTKENNIIINKLKEKNNLTTELKQKNFILSEKIIELTKKIETMRKNENNDNLIKKKNFDLSNKNIFGVVLKKINNNGTNYLNEAIEEAKKISKQTEELYKNQLDLLSDLRQNIESSSPKTVSSFSLNDEDIPQLDFADVNSEELFKKAEDKLIEKELQHKVQKELRSSFK